MTTPTVHTLTPWAFTFTNSSNITSSTSAEVAQATPRAGRVPTDFFYDEKGLWVKCRQPRHVYALDITFDVDFYPGLDTSSWKDFPGGRGAAIDAIQYRQQWCRRNCKCNPDGKIVPGPKGCLFQKTADSCTILLACYCYATLVQAKPIPNDIPMSDYQETLDRIPLSVRLATLNQDFEWRWGGSRLQFTVPTSRLVPANDQPYFIEGPDGELQHNWDTENGLDPVYWDHATWNKWDMGRPKRRSIYSGEAGSEPADGAPAEEPKEAVSAEAETVEEDSD
ncbi:hypothetical protein TWF481_010909 [Arthrobotrys musiformis]|uniref:Uncharacterized protein n=1 Tax=Arthrobotrys musiformis TaxID=47236 RepID=A0AAV9VYV9_9PEZI